MGILLRISKLIDQHSIQVGSQVNICLLINQQKYQ